MLNKKFYTSDSALVKMTELMKAIREDVRADHNETVNEEIYQFYQVHPCPLSKLRDKNLGQSLLLELNIFYV